MACYGRTIRISLEESRDFRAWFNYWLEGLDMLSSWISAGAYELSRLRPRTGRTARLDGDSGRFGSSYISFI